MLPDCLTPYKHYNEETISGVLDGASSIQTMRILKCILLKKRCSAGITGIF